MSNKTLRIPVSLGKPSFRLRLEAYYTLISPDIIADEAAWRKRFEQIYQKFGGSVEGEAKLASKLAKKYGNSVRLLLTTSAGGGAEKSSDVSAAVDDAATKNRNEEWYNLREEEGGSGVISFVSANFDPYAALSSDIEAVSRINPFVLDAPLIDNVSKFRPLLPPEDPQYMVPPQRKSTNHGAAAAATVAKATPKIKVPGAFTAIADRFDRGPFELLRKIHASKQRIRVMVRYVDCIRGTLTGYVLAFDKHMNMILRDVDEVYSGRATKCYEQRGAVDEGMFQSKLSNLEVEIKRRTCSTDGRQRKGSKQALCTSDVLLKRRHCQQLLVRGDNVVMVWRADDERSAFPPINPPVKSVYREQKNESGKEVDIKLNSSKSSFTDEEKRPVTGRIPSAGSLMAAMSWKREQRGGAGNGASY